MLPEEYERGQEIKAIDDPILIKRNPSTLLEEDETKITENSSEESEEEEAFVQGPIGPDTPLNLRNSPVPPPLSVLSAEDYYRCSPQNSQNTQNSRGSDSPDDLTSFAAIPPTLPPPPITTLPPPPITTLPPPPFVTALPPPPSISSLPPPPSLPTSTTIPAAAIAKPALSRASSSRLGIAKLTEDNPEKKRDQPIALQPQNQESELKNNFRAALQYSRPILEGAATHMPCSNEQKLQFYG